MWRVATNVKKCAVVVCNEDKVNPINFKWKWGEDELPIVDQSVYVPWRRDLKRLLLGCTHSESNTKGQIASRQEGCESNRPAP